MNIFLVSVILSTIALLGQTSPAEAEDTSWIERALDLQEDIDLDAPLSQALWIGTHNSYNAQDNGYFVDPNQKLSIKNQLKAGVRELVFDVHNVTFVPFGGSELFMCHGLCSLNGIVERTFFAGLQDVRDYLNTHDDVVLLKMELAIEGQHSELANNLNDILGDLLYTPLDQDPDKEGECQFLDQANLTKGQLLDAGKKVIVITNDCKSNFMYSNTVFGGLIHPEGLSTGSGGHKFISMSGDELGFGPLNECNNLVDFVVAKGWADTSDFTNDDEIRRDTMLRVFDNPTLNGVGSGDLAGLPHLEPENIGLYLDCGLNIFEMFWYGAEFVDSIFIRGPSRVELKEALVWSWAHGFPSTIATHENAYLDGNTNRFKNAPETDTHDFACREVGTSSDPVFNVWQVVSVSPARAFGEGEQTCLEETGGTHVFAVPRSKYELNELLCVAGNAAPSAIRPCDVTTPELWINYGKIADIWTADIGTPDTAASWTDTNQNGVHDDYEITAISSSLTVDEGDETANSGTVGIGATLAASRGTVINNDDGTWDWTYTHPDGLDTPTVEILATHGNGAITSINFLLIVENVAPIVPAPTLPDSLEGDVMAATVTFSDPAGAVDAVFNCTVDYGDGTGIHTGTSADGSPCNTAPLHVYIDNGEYMVEVTVTDKDGDTGTNSATQTVGNVAPQLTAGSNKSVDEGSPVGLGIDLFGRNLILNPGAESDTANFVVTGGFDAANYGPPGNLGGSSTQILVDGDTLGYLNSNLGTLLDDPDTTDDPNSFFPANRPDQLPSTPQVTLFTNINVGEGSSFELPGLSNTESVEICLNDTGFNNKVSRITFANVKTFILHNRCNHEGWQRTIPPDDFDDVPNNELGALEIFPLDPTTFPFNDPDLGAPRVGPRSLRREQQAGNQLVDQSTARQQQVDQFPGFYSINLACEGRRCDRLRD